MHPRFLFLFPDETYIGDIIRASPMHLAFDVINPDDLVLLSGKSFYFSTLTFILNGEEKLETYVLYSSRFPWVWEILRQIVY